MQTFVVECYWPRMIEEDARVTLERLVRFAAEASPGQAVRSFGCILVPADGMALFLLSAPNEAQVRHIGELTELPFDRIVKSVQLGFDKQPT
jgi:hypothetical protein